MLRCKLKRMKRAPILLTTYELLAIAAGLIAVMSIAYYFGFLTGALDAAA